MRLKLISCEIFLREFCACVARSPHIIDFDFLPKGLHDIGCEDMRARLQAAIDQVEERQYDALLAGLWALQQRHRGPDDQVHSPGCSARARLHHAFPGQLGALHGLFQ